MEYKVLKEKVREYNKKDAQFYGNIFAKMTKLEQVKTVVRLLAYKLLYHYYLSEQMINPIDSTTCLCFQKF